LSGDRKIVIARELTKIHETIVNDSLDNILQRVKNNSDMRKGEFVVLVAGHVAEKKPTSMSEEQKRILTLLLEECSIKTAVALTTKITGARKKIIYQAAIELTQHH
jgi:16S rRNA (cytidine1402-2'-O)-methyltransferase